MNRILSLLLLCLVLFSCHEEPVDLPSCSVQNPLVDLPWLKRIATDETLLCLEIEQGQYQGRTVYLVSTCGSCFAGGIATVY